MGVYNGEPKASCVAESNNYNNKNYSKLKSWSNKKAINRPLQGEVELNSRKTTRKKKL